MILSRELSWNMAVKKKFLKPQTVFASKILIKFASVSFYHMKCHIEIDAKLQNFGSSLELISK
jgi:hypothetical protein